MNSKQKRLLRQLEPYKGIIYFLILLFFFHFSWKLSIDGDMEGSYIYLFDKNITPDWFFTASRWLTVAAGWFVQLFPNTDSLVVNDHYLYFPDGGIRINIIWGCTGIKQMFIFCGIMIFYRWFMVRKLSYSRKRKTFNMSLYFPRFNRNKWWYIPMGCLLLSLYNVVRVGSTVLLTRGHPERFDELHDGIFRYIYYTIIFLLWVVWEEKYVKKNLRHENQRKNSVAS